MRFFSVLTLCLCLCLNAVGDTVWATRSSQTRSVRDMADWDFTLALKQRGWVLAKVEPKPMFWMVDDVSYKNVPSSLELKPDTEIRRVHEGAIQILNDLDDSPTSYASSYRIEDSVFTMTQRGNREPLFTYRSRGPENLERREDFSPFLAEPGGQVLCRVADATKQLSLTLKDSVRPWSERAESTPPTPRYTFLLADDTSDLVAPAFKFYKANRKLFSHNKAAKNQARLEALLGDTNPFLAAAACRTLASAGVVDDAFVQTHLAKAETPRQAMLTYSLLVNLPGGKANGLMRSLQEYIQGATNSAQLEGIATGAYNARRSWDHFSGPPAVVPVAAEAPGKSQSPTPLHLSESLLQWILEKQKTFGNESDTDRYVAHLSTWHINSVFRRH